MGLFHVESKETKLRESLPASRQSGGESLLQAFSSLYKQDNVRLAAMTFVCFVSLHQTMPLGFHANVINHLKFVLSFEVRNSTAH